MNGTTLRDIWHTQVARCNASACLMILKKFDESSSCLGTDLTAFLDGTHSSSIEPFTYVVNNDGFDSYGKYINNTCIPSKSALPVAGCAANLSSGDRVAFLAIVHHNRASLLVQQRLFQKALLFSLKAAELCHLQGQSMLPGWEVNIRRLRDRLVSITHMDNNRTTSTLLIQTILKDPSSRHAINNDDHRANHKYDVLNEEQHQKQRNYNVSGDVTIEDNNVSGDDTTSRVPNPKQQILHTEEAIVTPTIKANDIGERKLAVQVQNQAETKIVKSDEARSPRTPKHTRLRGLKVGHATRSHGINQEGRLYNIKKIHPENSLSTRPSSSCSSVSFGDVEEARLQNKNRDAFGQELSPWLQQRREMFDIAQSMRNLK